MLRALANLFFPELCVTCNNVLYRNEQFLCMACLASMPETGFDTVEGNKLERMFWGRVRVERAFSFLHFRKHSKVQHLLHELKYGNNPALGVYLGRLYGSKLKQSGYMPDAVAAIPLHKTKLRKRGYNQSAMFAEGLAMSLQVPHVSDAIVRVKRTDTQTNKSRFMRWSNVDTVFDVKNENVLKHKHLLLVDDVITTGATIEACVSRLGKVEGSSVSVASIAVTLTEV